MKHQLDDMKVFLAVVEARSFTAAASTLAVTTSAVSQAVTRIERSLGHKLLFRSTRSLSLTEAGSALLPKCREMRRIESDIEALFDGEQLAMPDTLTVTAPHALCRQLVVPALTAFLQDNEMISVRLIASDENVNLIDKRIDLAIRVGDTALQTAYRKRIGYLHEGLFASRAYIAERGAMPDELEDLADWQHVGSEWQGQPLVYSKGRNHTLSVMPRLRCNTVPDALSAVQEGLGVALLPDIAIVRSEDQLVRLFEMSRASIFAVHHYQGRAPKKVSLFTEVLKAQLKQHPTGRTDNR